MEKKAPELILRSYVSRFIDEDDGKSFVMNDADSNVVVSAMKHYATQETKPLQERIDQLNTLYNEMEANQEPLENRFILAEAKVNVLQERIDELEGALMLVLPMAKGYAHQHPIGSNQEIIEQAEQALKPQQ